MKFDKEIYCDNPKSLVEEAHKIIFESLGKLKYVNLKFKLDGQKESAWLYNIDFQMKDNLLCVEFLNADLRPIHIDLEAIEFLKLRPYYKAVCVGFKNIIFYNSQYQKGVKE